MNSMSGQIIASIANSLYSAQKSYKPRNTKKVEISTHKPIRRIIMSMKRTLYHFLPLAVILSVFTAFFLAGPVFAQDETPLQPTPEVQPVDLTAPPAADLTAQSTVLPTSTEALSPTPTPASPAALVPTQVISGTEIATSSDVSNSSQTDPVLDPESSDALQVISSAPAGVELALTDSSGNPVSLASADAATIIAAGDPYFIVSGVTYSFTTSDCDPVLHTACSNPIQAAVDWIRDHATIPTDGLIHIVAGTYSGMPVVFDGTNMYVNKIKGLQGVTVAPNNLPDVHLDSQIYVHDMTGIFTLSGLEVIGTAASDGMVKFENNAGSMFLQDMVIRNNSSASGSVGLLVNQPGAVTLNRVDSSGNNQAGANIDNSSGTKSVTITNGKFDRNTSSSATSLSVRSKGAVVLSNVSASNNFESGVGIDTTSSVTIKNSIFQNNTGYGLVVSGGNLTSVSIDNLVAYDNGVDGINIGVGGAVNLKNVTANSNSRRGAMIETCAGSPCTYTGTGTVTISNSTFSSNSGINGIDYEAGLFVSAKGAISLANVTSDNNGHGGVLHAFSYGTYLNNKYGPVPANISIVQGEFNNNAWTGVQIETKGSVILNTINANNNPSGPAVLGGIYGMYIDAKDGSGSVTLTSTLGDSNFTSNKGTGIAVLAKGSVSLTGSGYTSYVYSNGSAWGGEGFYINNTYGSGSVTLKGFYVYWQQENGIRILSHGAVNLDNITSTNNGTGVAETWGAKIDNSSATSAMPVTVSRTIFDMNTGGGLLILTKGNVTLNGIRASYNTAGGISPGYGLEVMSVYGLGSVTMLSTLGNNSFDSNSDSGVFIGSNGNVNLDNLQSANNTNGSGVLISTSGTGNVSVSRLNSVSNGNSGLNIDSSGNILVDNSTINNNGVLVTFNSGIILNNVSATTPKTVTVSRATIYGIPECGLQVTSEGLITLNNVNSSNNTGSSGCGAYLNNAPGTTAGVTILGTYGENQFNTNATEGLRVYSNGPVLMNKVTADGNLAGSGLVVDNSIGAGGVTLNIGSFSNNAYTGLSITSHGAITVNDLYSYSNGNVVPNPAVSLVNTTLTTSEPGVTVQRADISYETGTGLYIRSKGVVTINSIISKQNTSGGLGADIDNTASSLNSGISILGTYYTNEFVNDSGMGLKVISDGSITLDKINQSNSGSIEAGIKLENDSGNGNVTISNSSFTYNYYSTGLIVLSKGKVSWTGGHADNNGFYNPGKGASINNNAAVSPLGVTISNVTFNGNKGDGLTVLANGNIVLTGVSASWSTVSSGGFGVYLDNSGKSGGVSVIGPAAFILNDANGLYIDTTGEIKLSNFTSKYNTLMGVEVSNDHLGSTANVTLNGLDIQTNGLDGIKVSSRGNISLTSVNTSNNGVSVSTGSGTLLDNTNGVGKSIAVSKSIFTYNDGHGLYITSKGIVTLNGIQSTSNNTGSSWYGGYIDNHDGTGSVSIVNSLGTNKFSNDGNGLRIISAGAVTIAGVESSYNSQYGIKIQNDTATGNVTVSSCLVTDNSGGKGIDVLSKGVISLSGCTSKNNNGTGASLDNSGDTSGTKGVTVANSTFNYNGSSGNGLTILTHGVVVLSNLSAIQNSTHGVSVDNLTGWVTGTPGITLTGNNVFDKNYGTGFYARSKGVISLSNVTANLNSTGLDLANNSGSTTATITVINSTIKDNTYNGIMANSGGVITISGMMNFHNGSSTNSDGAALTSNGHDIKISNAIFNANGKSGIYALTGGSNTLHLTSVFYFGNNAFNSSAPDIYYDGALSFL
jgi:hypothetical protein